MIDKEKAIKLAEELGLKVSFEKDGVILVDENGSHKFTIRDFFLN